MGKTYSCTMGGCDMVFKRQFQLRKHIATHNEPESLFYCPTCDFYTLDKRNLKTHISSHTGEQPIQCPDTIGVLDSSGSPTQQAPCPYRTHDRSLLTRHRKRDHAYIPRSSPRSTFTDSVVSVATSASATTTKTTSRVKKPKQGPKKRDVVQRSKTSRSRVTGKAKKSSSTGEKASPEFPSTLQDGVDLFGPLASPDSPDAACSGSNTTTLVAPMQATSFDAHHQLAYVDSLYATDPSNMISDAPYNAISTHAHGQTARTVAGHSNNIPVAPDQDITDGYSHFGWGESLLFADASNMLTHAHGQAAYGASPSGPAFAGFNSTTSVAPNYGILDPMDVPFYPTTNVNCPIAPCTTAIYNNAPIFQMNTFSMGQMNAGITHGLYLYGPL